MATEIRPGVVSMDAVESVIECLRKLGAKPGEPIGVYTVGTDLVDAGHEPGAIVDALYTLEARRIIEILPGNQISLTKPL